MEDRDVVANQACIACPLQRKKSLGPPRFGVIRLDQLPVLARADAHEPVAVLEVPAHRVQHTLVETVRFRPAKIALELRAVDRVALVVAGAVGDEPNEGGVDRSGLAGLLGDDFAEPMHEVDASPLGLPARRCRSRPRPRAS